MCTGVVQLHENSCVIINKMKNASYDHEFNHAMTKKIYTQLFLINNNSNINTFNDFYGVRSNLFDSVLFLEFLKIHQIFLYLHSSNPNQ